MKRTTTSFLNACLLLMIVGVCHAEVTVPFAPPVVIPMGGWGGDVTVADVDSDGDIDIIGTTRNPNFFWVSANDGSGGFAPTVQHAAGIVPRAIIAADFDNDGVLDIATADEGGDSASVMVGDGAGGFALPSTFPTTPGATDLDAGDFNGDGLLDIAVAHRVFTGGRVMVLINSGGVGPGWLGFQPAAPYTIGSGSRSVQAIDVDLDGILDLMVTNRVSLSMSVLLGNGDGTFNPQIIYPAGIGPRDATAADFDGDGLIDLAVADFDGNAALIYLNLGRDSSGWLGLTDFVSYPNGGGEGSHGIDSGDVDGDGDIDLVLANSITANISVMLNDGAGAFTKATVEPDGNFSTAAVALGDFDADGDLDIASSSTSTSGSISAFINLTPTIPADLNGDSVVDTSDLGLLIGEFGTVGILADINCDGVVDTADLGLLIAGFTLPPGP